MTFAVITAAVVVTIAALLAARLLIPTFGTHHASRPGWHQHAAQARAALASWAAGWRKASGLGPEDTATVAWAVALHGRREHGPAAPARRPQLLNVARLRAAAIIRALPVEQIPWLQPGQGYADTTGTFKAITRGDQ